MALTDPVADFLTRIRNASNARKENVDVCSSRLISEILRILKQERYILNYKQLEEGQKGLPRVKNRYRVYLRMTRKNEPVIQGISKISKPGLRIYADVNKLAKIRRHLGVAVVSTSKGIMTDKEARKNKIGGEVVCRIW